MRKMLNTNAPVKDIQCRKYAANAKARLLKISRLCFALMLFISFLNAVIVVSPFIHWGLVGLIFVFLVVGVRLASIVHRTL